MFDEHIFHQLAKKGELLEIILIKTLFFQPLYLRRKTLVLNLEWEKGSEEVFFVSCFVVL